MKKLAMLLATALCIGAIGLPAYAADDAAGVVADAPAPEITLAVEWEGVRSERSFADRQQIELLTAFLPAAEEIVTGQTPLVGTKPVQFILNRVGTMYLFYSNSYVKEIGANGSIVWYKTKSGVWDLLLALTGCDPYGLDYSSSETTFFDSDGQVYDQTQTIYYNNEPVTQVYSLLYKDRTYHQVTHPADAKKIVAALEEKKPDPDKTMGNVGFLVVTQEGRYPFYLDIESDQELVNLSVEHTKQNPRIQWLAYMNPDKITSIRYTAKAGSRYSLTEYTEVMDVSLNTKNKDTIARISQYLKNIQISPETKRVEEAPVYKKSPSLVKMSITFESGTVYHLEGNNVRMTISASSMKDEYITYTAASSQMKALRDFISLMPGAKVSVNDPAESKTKK